MSVEKRTMAREPWKRLLEREYRWRAASDADFDGEIGLIHLIKVAAPLVKQMGGHAVRIVDDGYYWMQLAPRGKQWWLTAMLDEQGNIVQYYFDVTRENVLKDGGQSYFYDMFLDVVALPSGEIFLLDEDELAQALEAGEITREESDAAYRVADELIAWLPGALPRIEAMSRRYFEALTEGGEA